MRLLKKQIAQARFLRFTNNQRNHIIRRINQAEQPQHANNPPQLNPLRRTRRTSRVRRTSRQSRSMFKNYIKAINDFSISPLALPYLNDFLYKEGVELQGFVDFVEAKQRLAGGLGGFPLIYQEDQHVDRKTEAYWKIFRDIGVIFIQLFSVNWVFHSEIPEKEAHLKFRFKMLRRMKNTKLY